MSNNVCGTGGWGGPKPGDPNTSDLTLIATPAFGGIDINWSFPTLNPEAVAYTVIYRSLLNDPATMVKHVVAQGNFFYDKVDTAFTITYYYWIQVFSVFGTPGDVIGPAWSTAKPLIGDMMVLLTGQIDAGLLAGSLKTQIDQITLNKLGITQEMIERAKGDTSLAVSINTVSAFTGETKALLQQEVLARTSQGEAFVSTVNTLYASLDGKIGAVQSQTTVALTEVRALATRVDTVQTSFDGEIAGVKQTMTSEISTVNGKIASIGSLWTAQVTVNGLVGGFGVYNDGRTVEAGFDVDTFWIGRTGANKRKPFIVQDNTVYIDEAAIVSLQFSKLRSEDGSLVFANGKLQAKFIDVGSLVLNNVRSDNYVAGTQGWAFNADGTVEINGNASGGRMVITQSFIKIYDAAGRKRVQLGDLSL